MQWDTESWTDSSGRKARHRFQNPRGVLCDTENWYGQGR